MDVPWASMTGAAALTSYLTIQYTAIWPRTSSAFIGVFGAAWFAFFSLWALWTVILYPKVFSPLRDIPGPKNMTMFMGQFPRIQAEPSGVPHIEWVNTIPHNGLIRYLGIFNQERLAVVSPKALAEVLTTKSYDFPKPVEIRWALGRLLGMGVLVAEGDAHRMQRKNLLPAFAFRQMKNLYPLFWQKSAEVVQAVTDTVMANADKEEAGQGGADNNKTATIEIGSWASRATLDIIGVAGLGRDFGTIKDPDNALYKTYRYVFQPSAQAQILALLGLFFPNWLVRRLPVRRNEDVRAAALVIRGTCRDLIREKKERLAREKEKQQPTDPDILSVALGSGGFTDGELVDQLMTFLAAGHETTATALIWAVYLLCKHQDVQTRLREEVRAALPSPGNAAASITSADIERLPFLNAVCSEVLRCYAPVPMTQRVAARNTSIAGHRIPRGTRIWLPIWATNRDKALWGDDALEFNPARWLPRTGDGESAGGGGSSASGHASSNYAFMTFLHGPRSCIGQGFARAEFACLLAAFVGRFAFELQDPAQMDESKLLIKGGVTARPAKGLRVRATVVDGW